MNQNLNSQKYNFDYSDDVIQLNNNSKNVIKEEVLEISTYLI